MRRTGLYRVTGADLAKAGVPIGSIEKRSLRLLCQGREVALSLSGPADARLAPEDVLLFYGVGLDTTFTDTNVYWLSWGGAPGRRWAARPGGVGSGSKVLRSYREVAHLEENYIYGRLTIVPTPGEIPHWFWSMVQPDKPAEVPFSLDDLSGDGPAPEITLRLWGNTALPEVNPDHHTQILLNGHMLDNARWDGQTERRIRRQVPRDWLTRGPNKLVVRCPGDTAAGPLDYVYLDWVDVAYQRDLAASEGSLAFTVPPGNWSVEVTGTAGGAPVALDVTHPEAPVAVDLPAAAPAGDVRFGARSAAPATYLVTSVERARPPAWIAPAGSSDLQASTQAADYLIIAGDGLADAVKPLAEWRRKHGLRVAVVSVNDIYDQFSHGIFTPVAIRSFLAWAREHWQKPAPRFVLLVGDGSYDYRNYLGLGATNRVPPFLVRVRNGMEEAFDGAYVSAGPADPPALAIGRIPARTADEVRVAAEKIVAYEQASPAPWQNQVLMVSDHDRSDDEPGWYEQSCDSTARSFAGSKAMFRKIAVRQPALLALNDMEERVRWVRQHLTPELLKAIDEGAVVVEYQGHGDAQYWSRYHLFDEGDVDKLRNEGRLPVFLEISCFTGWFDNPRLGEELCLAARLLFHPEGGAVACVSASRLGGNNLDAGLWTEWRKGRVKTLGEALQAAWQEAWEADGGFWPAAANYNLLGDPALRMPLPDLKVPEKRPEPPSPEKVAQAQAMTVPPLPLPPLTGIRLETGFVSTPQVPRLPNGSLPAPEGGWPKGYYLVRFAAAQAGAGKQSVVRAGGQVLDAVEEDAVVASLTPAAAAALAADKGVRWLGPFLPVYKVAAPVAAQTLALAGTLVVRVRCFRASERAAVAARLPSVGGKCLGLSPAPQREMLRARLPIDAVCRVAEWPEVRAILSDEGKSPAGRAPAKRK